MYRLLVLGVFCLTIFACDSDTGNSPVEQTVDTLPTIHSLKWLPGDSLIAAIVHDPQRSDSTRFRIYDLQGNLRSEIPLYFEHNFQPGEFYVATNGRHAIYNGETSVYSIDIEQQTVKPVYGPGRVASRAPGNDCYIIIDNSGFTGKPTAALTKIIDGIVDTLCYLPESSFKPSFGYESPHLLTQDRIASLETDTTFSPIFLIRDVKLNIKKQFFMPRSIFFSKVITIARNDDFFFLSLGGALQWTITKFRTDIGVMDLIQLIPGDNYAVTSNGDRVIYQTGDGCIVKTVETGVETSIPILKQFKTFEISHNDKMIAYTTRDESGRVLIANMP